MSNYTGPDKSSGETLAATEWNEMKAAVNSKVDPSGIPAQPSFVYTPIANSVTTQAFNAALPNLKTTLSGDYSFSITGVTEGLGGEHLIARGSGGTETITLNGTLITNAPTGAGVVVIMQYENQGGVIGWYCVNVVSASSETGDTIVTKLQALSGSSRLDASAVKNLPIGTVASDAGILAFLTANGVTVTPAAPLSVTIDNTARTATFVPPSGYAASLIEYSLDTGSTWADTTNGVATVGNGAISASTIKGRIKAGTNRNAGAVLTSSTGFTAVDTTAPTVSSAGTTDATHIQVVFSEATTPTTAGWSFKKNGSSLAITSVSGSGTTWSFLVATMANGDTLLRSYDASTGNTLDTAGNELASFTDQAVTNNIAPAATVNLFAGPAALDDNAAWEKQFLTVTANAATAPDGSTTADKLIPTTGAVAHETKQTITKAAAIKNYVLSFYVKAAELSNFKIAIGYSGDSNAIYWTPGIADFYGASGYVINGVPAGVADANGYTRYNIKFTSTANTSMPIYFTVLDSSNNSGFAGNGTDGLLATWFMLEEATTLNAYHP